MENSTLLSEDPERTPAYKAMHKKLYPRGSTIDVKTGKNNAIMSNVGGFSNPKNRGKKRKVMGENSVSDIVRDGVSSYLNQNKNISVKDLLTKKGRQTAGNQLKTTFKSSALDTGQNVINHLRKEEVSRRKRPSNVRKAKRLEYALLTLKQKKDDAKKAGALKEGDARADKLADAVRSGITTGTISSTSKVKKLDKIITKIRGIKESRVMNSSSIEKSGPIIDVEVIKDKKKKEDEKKNGAIVKSKGSDLATQGKRDNEVKDERKPKPYRNKKGKGIKGPSKDAINKTVSKVGSAAKKGLSAFTSGYDNEDVKESKSFKHFTELAATSLDEALPLAIPAGIAAVAKTAAVVKAAAPYVATAIGAGGMIYNMSKKKDEVKRPKDPVKPTPKDGESWTGGIEGRPTRNLSGRYKTYKKNQQKLKDFNDKLTTSSPGVEYKKQPKTNIKKGDNPEERANIRDMIKKNIEKNNKLYNDYHNPKPPG